MHSHRRMRGSLSSNSEHWMWVSPCPLSAERLSTRHVFPVPLTSWTSLHRLQVQSSICWSGFTWPPGPPFVDYNAPCGLHGRRSLMHSTIGCLSICQFLLAKFRVLDHAVSACPLILNQSIPSACILSRRRHLFLQSAISRRSLFIFAVLLSEMMSSPCRFAVVQYRCRQTSVTSMLVKVFHRVVGHWWISFPLLLDYNSLVNFVIRLQCGLHRRCSLMHSHRRMCLDMSVCDCVSRQIPSIACCFRSIRHIHSHVPVSGTVK
jgi:hypothetical protein